MPRHPEVFSVVERGWHGARACSLVLRTHDIAVTHVMKGSLSAEVRAMIQPYPSICLIDVPRSLFRLYVWLLLVWRTAMKRVRWVVIDNERTLQGFARWCQWCGLMLVLIRETEGSYELSVGGNVRSLEEVFRTGFTDASLQR